MLSAICSDLRNRGIEPGEILMSQDLYFWCVWMKRPFVGAW